MARGIRGHLWAGLFLLGMAVVVLTGRTVVWERVNYARVQRASVERVRMAASRLAEAYARWLQERDLGQIDPQVAPAPGHEPGGMSLRDVTVQILAEYDGVEGGFRSGIDGAYYGFAFPTSPPPAPAYGPPPREVAVLDSLTDLARWSGTIQAVWVERHSRFAVSAAPLPDPSAGVAWTLFRRSDVRPPGALDGWFLLAFGLALGGGLLLVISAFGFRRQATALGEDIDALGDNLAHPVAVPADPDLGSIALTVRALAASLMESRAAEQQLATDLSRTERMAALGRLAAGVAHEVRSPLAGIRTRLELWLRRVPETVRHDPVLPEVLQQIDRLSRLVDQLYHLAHVGRLALEADDLGAAVRRGVEAARVQAGTVRIQLDLDEDLPAVPHNGLAIERVVVNLVQNAVQAGADTVTVRLRQQAGQVVLDVEDDGPGPGPEGTDHWFEPFVSGRPDGLGLGLAFCYEVARRHGGTIHAERASPDGGTCIRMILPLRHNGL